MCKRLKGKEEIGYSRKRKSIRGQMVTVYQDEPRFKKSVLVSAVEGLIKYHEDEIDDLIFAMEHTLTIPTMLIFYGKKYNNITNLSRQSNTGWKMYYKKRNFDNV